MAGVTTVERRAGDDGPEYTREQPQSAVAEDAARQGSGPAEADRPQEDDVSVNSLYMYTPDTLEAEAATGSHTDADAAAGEDVKDERTPSQRDIDAALGRRLRDAERKAYRRFMEEHAHRLHMGDIAMNILGYNAGQPVQGEYAAPQPPYAQPTQGLPPQGLPYPQPAQQYAQMQPQPEQPYPQQPQQHAQAQLPDPAALVRAAQREIDAIGDPDFTLESVMADDRARFMLAQGRDIYEIYGRLRQVSRQGRQAPRPRVEARANSGMDSVEYDFRNAPREVIDRIDAQLKRGQYVNL